MQNPIEHTIAQAAAQGLTALFNIQTLAPIKVEPTNANFSGDYTINVFPFLKLSGKNPEELGSLLGNWLVTNSPDIEEFNIVKGFLNLTVNPAYWLQFYTENASNIAYGTLPANGKKVMVEYPSPNTNKPLHLGHLRNIFLGASVSNILATQGYEVIHACLYNDRGTNICKSMLAYQRFGSGETPETANLKGDHLVGSYYVKYANAYKDEIAELTAQGHSKEEAEKLSQLNAAVNEMLVRWEQGDPETRNLWATMNGWVYRGFDQTYQTLNIQPDKFYYESDVYNLGKETVAEGLEKGVFFKKPDGSIWIDLTDDGLDEKVVLRSNGTTVYITQDIAVANEKEREFGIDHSIYVVGNEQDYHFKVLFLILKKLGRKYADNLYHLSYGMVELPSGKMKSREGTVVDADDLLEEMIETARLKTEELGKVQNLPPDEALQLYKTIGIGALRYFILKVDPKKKILFNPLESVDFNGHTGPFIQYTHARIKSILRKAVAEGIDYSTNNTPENLHPAELALLKRLYSYTDNLAQAARSYDPSAIANYAYFLACDYNRLYHDCPILKEENSTIRNFRLQLSAFAANTIRNAMALLSINVPEQM